MTCYKILLQKGTWPAIELILEKAFPFLLFILILSQVISAGTIIKKMSCSALRIAANLEAHAGVLQGF